MLKDTLILKIGLLAERLAAPGSLGLRKRAQVLMLALECNSPNLTPNRNERLYNIRNNGDEEIGLELC